MPPFGTSTHPFCCGATGTPVLHLGHIQFSMDCNLPEDGHPSKYGPWPWLLNFSDSVDLSRATDRGHKHHVLLNLYFVCFFLNKFHIAL